MPTNPPTVTALRKMAALIEKELKPHTSQDVVDEIKARNRLLLKHLRQQSREKNRNQFIGHKYKYDKEQRILLREGKDGKFVKIL